MRRILLDVIKSARVINGKVLSDWLYSLPVKVKMPIWTYKECLEYASIRLQRRVVRGEECKYEYGFRVSVSRRSDKSTRTTNPNVWDCTLN